MHRAAGCTGLDTQGVRMHNPDNRAPWVEEMWRIQDHLHKALIHAGEDFYRTQLLPGPRFESFWPDTLSRLDPVLTPDRYLKGAARSQRLSLLDLCKDVLLGPVLAAFFGNALLEHHPDIINTFLAFDDVGWKINYKIPQPFSKDTHLAKDSLIAAVVDYLKLAKDKRSDACWLVQTLEAEMRQAGMPDRDIAALEVSVIWTSLSNSYKLCFWMLAYLLFDSLALQLAQAEARKATTESLGKSETTLEETYPRMIALFNEALRMTTSSASVRTVAAPTQVGKYILRPGSKLLLPFRQMHMNEQVFGSDVGEFKADRFLKNDLSKSPSFRPFGGGITYCPGRYLARREVVAVVVLVLKRFDIKIAAESKAKFPHIDMKKPCLGVMSPFAGEDLELHLQHAS